MSERRDFALATEHILEDNPSLSSPLLSSSSQPAFPLVGVQPGLVKGVAVGNAVEELALECLGFREIFHQSLRNIHHISPRRFIQVERRDDPKQGCVMIERILIGKDVAH